MLIYTETCRKIKALEIQGAEAIAIAGVRAFAEKLAETTDEKVLKAAVQELGSLRATEPALRNAVRYCFLHRTEDPRVTDTAVKFFETAKRRIAEIGAKKIRDGMTIFTHCHASTVTAILLQAWREGRRFTVRNTETRPRFQGRKTTQELAEAGIPVVHGVDSSGRLLLQKADLFLFGADAITAEGNVVNKIGTTMFAAIARAHEIPIYSCTNSWKFDPLTLGGADEPIEERSTTEVWEAPPAGVKIINPAFELTPADQITGIITELGIFKPETLVTEIKKAYPWLIDELNTEG